MGEKSATGLGKRERGAEAKQLGRQWQRLAGTRALSLDRKRSRTRDTDQARHTSKVARVRERWESCGKARGWYKSRPHRARLGGRENEGMRE